MCRGRLGIAENGWGVFCCLPVSGLWYILLPTGVGPLVYFATNGVGSLVYFMTNWGGAHGIFSQSRSIDWLYSIWLYVGFIMPEMGRKDRPSQDWSTSCQTFRWLLCTDCMFVNLVCSQMLNWGSSQSAKTCRLGVSKVCTCVCPVMDSHPIPHVQWVLGLFWPWVGGCRKWTRLSLLPPLLLYLQELPCPP